MTALKCCSSRCDVPRVEPSGLTAGGCNIEVFGSQPKTESLLFEPLDLLQKISRRRQYIQYSQAVSIAQPSAYGTVLRTWPREQIKISFIGEYKYIPCYRKKVLGMYTIVHERLVTQWLLCLLRSLCKCIVLTSKWESCPHRTIYANAFYLLTSMRHTILTFRTIN